MNPAAKILDTIAMAKRSSGIYTARATAKSPKATACKDIKCPSTTKQPNGPSDLREKNGVEMIPEMTPNPKMIPT